MKVAQHPDTHQPVTDAADTPTQALCPTCGGVVLLRHRRRMDGVAAYYWRHPNHAQRQCYGRSRPAPLDPR